MKYRIYRNLDRPLTLLGLQGKFLALGAVGIGAAGVLALVAGVMTSAFVGLFTGLSLGAVVYLRVAEWQGAWGEKGLSRRISGLMRPRFILIRSKVWNR